ncbi:MAG: FMN-binding protein [Thermincolia bacterium]
MSRPWRLVLLTGLLALIFPAARLLLACILGGLLVLKFFALGKEKGRQWQYAGSVLGLMVALVGYTLWEGNRVAQVFENSTLDLAQITDGTYEGSGYGLKGPIKVMVTVTGGQIKDIVVKEHGETVSIAVPAMTGLTGVITAHQHLEVDAVSGATMTSIGFKGAVENALWQGVKEKESLNPLASLGFFLLTNDFKKETFNSLAVLFIVVMLFDYSIQGVLTRNTGQTLNCMNCQTCVGACPVKMVEQVPFPMTMVLEARLGNYERVAHLSQYCVGCAKCTGKCPVGISAPSVAGSVNELMVNSSDKGGVRS